MHMEKILVCLISNVLKLSNETKKIERNWNKFARKMIEDDRRMKIASFRFLFFVFSSKNELWVHLMFIKIVCVATSTYVHLLAVFMECLERRKKKNKNSIYHKPLTIIIASDSWTFAETWLKIIKQNIQKITLQLEHQSLRKAPQ